jgi:integrase
VDRENPSVRRFLFVGGVNMACITKRRDRWVIDFYDQYGKRRWKTMPEGTTKKKAREELRKTEDSIQKGSYLAPAKVPVFSSEKDKKGVAEIWLKAKKPDIRYSTFRNYEGHITNHLRPYFGAIRITRINYTSIERFIQHCQDEGVSIPTLKKVLRTLGAIMTYACKRRFIDYNPVRDIEKPKGKSHYKEDEEMHTLAPEQILALFNATEDVQYKTLFMVAALSGMRQGEVLGLKWQDIDWEDGQIHVKRTFTSNRFYNPKSKTSKRKIDLAPQLIAQLKEWQLACPPNKNDLFFPGDDGKKPLDPSPMVKRHFLPALKAAKLPRIRFHDLRHTYASLLIDQGENPKYIQNQMGHSSINITFDTYGHLMKDTNQESASKLGNTIFKSGSKMVAEAKKEGGRNA